MTSNNFLRSPLPLSSLVRAGIAAIAVLITVGLQLASGTLPAARGAAPAVPASWFANEWLRDRFLLLQAQPTPENRILVVDIDEASIAAIGAWPWPRERLAALLENLLDTYGARGVALDLVLPEPADTAGDRRLSMLAHHAPVVMAAAFDYDLARAPPLRVGRIGGGIVETASDTKTGSRAAPATAAGGFIANHAGLAAATRTGNIGFIPDTDGVIRRLPLQTRFDGHLYPTLSLALYGCCAGTNLPPLRAQADSLWRIPYGRRWEAYTVVSAADILHQRLAPDALRGRLALIGSSSLGLADRVATPLAASTSGLLVHAAALTSMLDHQAGTAPASWPGVAIAIGFTTVVAALAAATLPRLSAATNVIMLAGAGVLWLVLAYVISPHDPVVMLSAPLASILFLLAVGVPFDWQITQVKSRRLLGTLNQYVAKSVVAELMRSNLKDPLSPVRREVTTLIADMEGYTSHVAALAVEDAAQLTRDFLECLTLPVLEKSGTLDKYTGDGLVAFWGAPLPAAEHADLALDAARRIVQEVRRLSLRREHAGLPKLRVRIGIESGFAMAGDFGTAFRSIYTAVGDSVNVASRLEQLARDYPFDVIVGPGTAARAQRHTLHPLGGVVLRGKDNPTALYALEVAA